MTHVDGTARIQIADPGAHPQLHDLVAKFGELTGTPVLLNTSFNNNAEPIVQTVDDVLVTFLSTALDYVAVGDFLVSRTASIQQNLARLTLRFLPLTRLVEQIGAGRPRLCELRLEYSRGPSERISPEVFGLLRATQTEPAPKALGDYGVPITEPMAAELIRLWSKRLFALAPDL